MNGESNRLRQSEARRRREACECASLRDPTGIRQIKRLRCRSASGPHAEFTPLVTCFKFARRALSDLTRRNAFYGSALPSKTAAPKGKPRSTKNEETTMAKVLCVLYDDPVDGYPKTYARDDIPQLTHYPRRPNAAVAKGY